MMINTKVNNMGDSLCFIQIPSVSRKKVTEVCIIDNGISIPKSFDIKKYNIPNDTEALKKAIEGLSTKSDVERGFGLRTSLNLLSEGLNASCLIVSGSAGLIAKKNRMAFYSMEELNRFDGTLISTRIPDKLKKVDIYDYIDQ